MGHYFRKPPLYPAELRDRDAGLLAPRSGFIAEQARDRKSEEADRLLVRHHGFANAVALFQIAIALGAVLLLGILQGILLAALVSVLMLLLMGWGGHNLFRYTWLWYGGFLIIARHCNEAAILPVCLRLLDPFGPRGDEVPPNVARAVHSFAADQDEPRGLIFRIADNDRTWAQHQKLAG